MQPREMLRPLLDDFPDVELTSPIKKNFYNQGSGDEDKNTDFKSPETKEAFSFDVKPYQTSISIDLMTKSRQIQGCKEARESFLIKFAKKKHVTKEATDLEKVTDLNDIEKVRASTEILESKIRKTQGMCIFARTLIVGCGLLGAYFTYKNLRSSINEFDEIQQLQYSLVDQYQQAYDDKGCTNDTVTLTCEESAPGYSVEEFYNKSECYYVNNLDCAYSSKIPCPPLNNSHHTCFNQCCDITQKFFERMPDSAKISQNWDKFFHYSSALAFILAFEALSLALAKLKKPGFKEPQLLFYSITKLTTFFSKRDLALLSAVAEEWGIHVEPKDIIKTVKNFKSKYRELYLNSETFRQDVREIFDSRIYDDSIISIISEYQASTQGPRLR